MQGWHFTLDIGTNWRHRPIERHVSCQSHSQLKQSQTVAISYCQRLGKWLLCFISIFDFFQNGNWQCTRRLFYLTGPVLFWPGGFSSRVFPLVRLPTLFLSLVAWASRWGFIWVWTISGHNVIESSAWPYVCSEGITVKSWASHPSPLRTKWIVHLMSHLVILVSTWCQCIAVLLLHIIIMFTCSLWPLTRSMVQ